jgi:peroxiredoxin
LRRDRDRLQEAGLAVVAIGQGTPEQAAWFRQHFKLPFPVLADPERQAYRAFGLGTARASNLVKPDLLLATARTVASGIAPGRTMGDRRQLPGTFLIDRHGIIRWAKPAKHAADLATTDEILSAAKQVVPTAPSPGQGAERPG